MPLAQKRMKMATRTGEVNILVDAAGFVEVTCTRDATPEEKLRNPGMQSIEQVVRVMFKADGSDPAVATSSCGSD